jgi:hypothetical protein
MIESVVCYFRAIFWWPYITSGDIGEIFACGLYLLIAISIAVLVYFLLYWLYIDYIARKYVNIFKIFCLSSVLSFHLLYPIVREHEFRWSDTFYPSYVHNTVLAAVSQNNISTCNNLMNIHYNENYSNRYNDSTMYFHKIWLVDRKYTYFFPKVALHICRNTIEAVNQNDVNICYNIIDDMRDMGSIEVTYTDKLDKCEMILIANKCHKYFNEYKSAFSNADKNPRSLSTIDHIDNIYSEKIDDSSKMIMRSNFDIAANVDGNPIGNEYLTKSDDTSLYVYGDIQEITPIESKSDIYDIKLRGDKRTASIRLKTKIDIHGIKRIYFRLSDINESGVFNDDILNKIHIDMTWNRACNPNRFIGDEY